jgi:hypothetical protein
MAGRGRSGWLPALSDVIDFAEKRTLREIRQRLTAIEAENRALRLSLEPALRARVALMRVCEFQDRFAGLLKHVRAPLQEAIAWEIARQRECGEAPDYRRALALVCGFGVGEYEHDLVGECRSRIAAEYARLSSAFEGF